MPCREKTGRVTALLSEEQVPASGDHRLEPVRQLYELELARVFRVIKRVTHHDLAQFGHGVDITEHAVEQVEEPLQVVVGIACRTWEKQTTWCRLACAKFSLLDACSYEW